MYKRQVVDGCFNKPEDAPFGIGHEMSGVIEKLGKNATAKGLKVGDRVGGNFLGYCGKCYQCSIGHPEYCTDVGNEPCMAEYVVWNESQVCKLPDGVSLREGSLMAVSYTHLDVYKRQCKRRADRDRLRPENRS